MKRLTRVGWIAASFAAAALLILFFRSIDFAPLQSLSAGLWVRGAWDVIAFQLLIVALHSLQWGLLLSSAGIAIPIPRLHGARLAGPAVSILSPSLSIGGELVRGCHPRRDGSRSGATFSQTCRPAGCQNAERPARPERSDCARLFVAPPRRLGCNGLLWIDLPGCPSTARSSRETG